MISRKKSARGSVRNRNIDPDEVLLDAFNLPSFDTNQFEGRVERSIQGSVPLLVGLVAVIIFTVFLVQVWNLQIARGEAMALLSRQNNVNNEVLFAERGVIYDRNQRELAWNVLPEGSDPSSRTYSLRNYANRNGLGHLLGFVGYPEKDVRGFWWRTDYIGKAGVELSLNNVLRGKNGVRIIEVDARNNIQSENTIRSPVDGNNVTLSIDVDLQEDLYNALRNGARESGFVGAAGVIMDVTTGEVLALTSYPEYSSQVMTDGVDTEKIRQYAAAESGQPFLNRAVLGEYTPGSIVKPYIAAAALSEKLVTPLTSIFSTGEIRVPNPYVPGEYSIFRDWKAHGWVNVREAIAVSSNVYFYAIGGGYEGQEGLGIERLAAYATRFGFGVPTGIALDAEGSGIVPTPSWKKEVFGEDNPWRIGNTYHTSIGQFGFLVTPIQAVRYIAAIANGGSLLTPRLITGEQPQTSPVGIPDEYLEVVRQGMRQGVESGTAAAVNVSGIRIAAKTGTAQIGVNNESMNSWVIGFWPADNPRFAFSAVLEKAPAGTPRGAAPALQSFFQAVVTKYPAYAQGTYPSIGGGVPE
jgi:penicillin-binding protein 2